MSDTRNRLPNRRAAVTFTATHNYPGAREHAFTASVGLYDDGRIGELFVSLVDDTDKRVNVDMHDAAVVVSFALQHGASLTEMGKAMLRGDDGRAHGFLGTLIDALAEIAP